MACSDRRRIYKSQFKAPGSRFGGEDDNIEYKEGSFVGYRHYEAKNIPVRYEFGYGLSYTQFEYSNLQVETVSKMDTVCKVTCQVKNIGTYDGDEVVQLYVRDEVASIAPASKLLKGFQKVHINKGETRQVIFYLTERDLSVYSAEKGWHFEAGEFTMMVGGSSNEGILQHRIWIK